MWRGISRATSQLVKSEPSTSSNRVILQHIKLCKMRTTASGIPSPPHSRPLEHRQTAAKSETRGHLWENRHAVGNTSFFATVFFESVPQLIAGDPQQLSGPCLVVTGRCHRALDHLPIHILERHDALRNPGVPALYET